MRQLEIAPENIVHFRSRLSTSLLTVFVGKEEDKYLVYTSHLVKSLSSFGAVLLPNGEIKTYFSQLKTAFMKRNPCQLHYLQYSCHKYSD